MALEPDVGSAFMDDNGVLNIICKAQYMEWIPLIISAGLGIGIRSTVALEIGIHNNTFTTDRNLGCFLSDQIIDIHLALGSFL